MQSESAKIFIKADKSETMDAMQSQIDELISNLNDKGIKIESFELSLNDKSDFTENFEKNQQDQKKQKENLKDKQQFINSFGQEKSSASIS